MIAIIEIKFWDKDCQLAYDLNDLKLFKFQLPVQDRAQNTNIL